MPPKKAARTEASATAAEAHRHEVYHWIEAHDELLGTCEPLTISALFDSMTTRKSFARNGQEHTYDWSAFREALEQRTFAHPRWFIQSREEDLLLEPEGLEGATLECFVVAEASEPTLAPAHYIVKEHWPNSDPEDNAPERVLLIKDQGMFWRPVCKNDGSLINTYVLSKKAEAKPAAAAAPAFNFGFGGPAPSSVAPATGGFAFGFGAPAAATPAPAAAAPISFGFPAAAPAAPTTVQFGFGAPAPAAKVEEKPFDPVAAAKAAKPFKPLRPSEIFFVLWSKARVRDMLKELRSGSRIVQEGVKIGADGKTLKVVMQNDLKDDVDKTARDLLLHKVFAKLNSEVRKVDKWLDDCPVYDEGLAPHLQKFRARYLKEQSEDDSSFQKILRDYEPTIVAELTKMVSLRKELVRNESAIVEQVAELLKEEKIADKSSFKILKYYPNNNVLPFRPFGKVSGISEQGEHADFCWPPMYVFKNKLLKN